MPFVDDDLAALEVLQRHEVSYRLGGTLTRLFGRVRVECEVRLDELGCQRGEQRLVRR